MKDTGKLLLTETGEDHPLIGWQWVVIILFLINGGIRFHSLWRQWQLRRQFYWLWYEVPDIPSFDDLLYLALLLIPTALGIAAALATGKAISKTKILVYENGIEGYGLKTWDFWPRVHKFELAHSEIKSVKKRRWGVSIRSTEGRYALEYRKIL